MLYYRDQLNQWLPIIIHDVTWSTTGTGPVMFLITESTILANAVASVSATPDGITWGVNAIIDQTASMDVTGHATIFGQIESSILSGSDLAIIWRDMLFAPDVLVLDTTWAIPQQLNPELGSSFIPTRGVVSVQGQIAHDGFVTPYFLEAPLTLNVVGSSSLNATIGPTAGVVAIPPNALAVNANVSVAGDIYALMPGQFLFPHRSISCSATVSVDADTLNVERPYVPPEANSIATAVWKYVIDGLTAEEIHKIGAAVLFGEEVRDASGNLVGYLAIDGSGKLRVSKTPTAPNRVGVSVDPS